MCRKRQLNWVDVFCCVLRCLLFWIVFSLCICLYCFVSQYQSSNWLWRSPWLCRVGRLCLTWVMQLPAELNLWNSQSLLLLAGIKRSLFFQTSCHHLIVVQLLAVNLLCSVRTYTYFMRPFFHHQHLHPMWTAPSASPQLHIWFGLFVAVLTSFALITHQGVVTGQWVTLLFGWDRGWAFWLRPNTTLSGQLWS